MACQEVKIEAPDGKDVDVTIRLPGGHGILKRLQEDINDVVSLVGWTKKIICEFE